MLLENNLLELTLLDRAWNRENTHHPSQKNGCWDSSVNIRQDQRTEEEFEQEKLEAGHLHRAQVQKASERTQGLRLRIQTPFGIDTVQNTARI